MGVSKIIFGDTVLIDLTGDTVTAATLDKGATAHDKAGNQIVGTMEAGESSRFGATLDTFLGDVDSNGVLQAPSAETNLVFSGVTDLGDNALAYVYRNSSGIKSLAFPNLGKISGTSAMLSICYNCKSLASVQFPILKEVTANSACQSMLRGCTLLESIKFPFLETITGHEAFSEAFASCSNLESVQFPKLKKIGDDTATGTNAGHFYYAFYNASKVTSLEFPELTAIYCTSIVGAGTFYGNDRIQKMYFPKLSVIDKSPAHSSVATSDAQNNIFDSCDSLTEIHFGAANQAAIEATSGYPTLWGRGAGNATVYFDL